MGKTVFILGAGASKDFGEVMPVGAQLANLIANQLLHEIDRESGGPDGLIVSTFRQFKGGWSSKLSGDAIQIVKSISAKDSIDELLDEWSTEPDMVKIGKCAIAACLLTSESGTVVSPKLNDDLAWARALQTVRHGWAGALFRKAGGPGLARRRAYQAFQEIAFVTFNYDRCLEQFLLGTFRHSCGLNEVEAFEALSTVEIIHAYGDLGILTPTNTPANVPYGHTDPWSINHASSRIRTFTEDFVTGHDVAIRNVISSAARLVFIGFGYHPRNLDLLFGIGKDAPDVPCIGTAPPRGVSAVAAKRFETARSHEWVSSNSKEFMEEYGEYALAL